MKKFYFYKVSLFKIEFRKRNRQHRIDAQDFSGVFIKIKILFKNNNKNKKNFT
jgi:hypothetical protein